MRLFWTLKGQIRQGIWLNDSKVRLDALLLQMQQALEEKEVKGSLFSYLLALQRDLKKLLVAKLQQAQLPIPNQLSQIDSKPSFWAGPDREGAPSFRWIARERAIDLEEPNMHAIYRENRLID